MTKNPGGHRVCVLRLLLVGLASLLAAGGALAEPRTALVIGNGSYEWAVSPVARDLAARLCAVGVRAAVDGDADRRGLEVTVGGRRRRFSGVSLLEEIRTLPFLSGESVAGGRVVIQERGGRVLVAILGAQGYRVYRPLRAVELGQTGGRPEERAAGSGSRTGVEELENLF